MPVAKPHQIKKHPPFSWSARKELFLAIITVFLIAAIFVIKPPGSLNQEALAKEAAKIVNICQKEPKQWRTCYGSQFATLVTSRDFDTALTTLHLVQDMDGKTRDCHLIAHRMASAQVAKNPSLWQEFLGQVTASECIGGFIHGAIETHRRDNPSFVVNEQTIPQVCELTTKNQGTGYCVHMFGHILLVETQHDIPQAIDICAKLGEKVQFNCYTGSFMENITRDNLVDHGLAEHVPYNEESAKNQEKVCNQFTGEKAKACWQEITHYYTHLADHDPKRLYEEFCSRADSEPSQDACFLHGVTFIAGKPDLDEDIDMDNLCNPFSGEDQKRAVRCINTIIFVLTNSSPKFAETVIHLCSKGLSQDNQKGCFKSLGQRLSKLVSSDEMHSLCTPVPDEYRNFCQRS